MTCALGLLLLAGGPIVEREHEELDAVQRHYDQVRDLSAEFEQTSSVVAVGREEVSSGSLQVKRPGRMRWEYKKPERRIIAMNGDTLKLYDPAEKQLQIAPISSGAISPTALGFLLGRARLRDTFEVEGEIERTDDELAMKLKPTKDAGFEFLTLRLDADTYQLKESVVVDLFGNRTQVRFRDVRENTGIAEENFSITVPDDTEVIDLR